MRGPAWLRPVMGELLGSALLVAVMFGSGAVRGQLGAGTMAGALLGSIALGLGYGLVLWSFGGLSGAQTNPLITLIASAMGGQPWRSAGARVLAQLCGAGAATSVASRLAPLWAAGNATVAGTHGLGEAMASLGFVLVALGVAQRRDIKVPLALGAFATASFWMTGHATVGNPLLVLSVFVVRGEHDTGGLLTALGSAALGAGLAVAVARFLFPRAREAASCLLFVPRGLRR
ncbi:aquaporin [Sorangium sp. So ce448]|uniref:aquaporin n=1 Tax=Sorangium sp. So ce448 TaxID=3133314 RepID=UPI003F62B4F4